ncbi:hypothetical protein BDM02DRAFT_3099226 [Thelephora ganbajun]|uniref:Uncharacterized protein n=1 Tax=Thelephora ganbajun TaxID=370292 RepID=A0ACB6ZCF2_THEGA|nr:hypothetical protein BDM02DRAFT_3099226 [Thelephora ganbajun]
MSSQDGREDEFTHQLAIKLSRALNIVNPNDLLARRVQDIAKSNSADQFMQAAKSFGKFSDAFLIEIHREILSHVNQEAMENLLQPSHGIVVQDTDVLQPEPIRQGGLVRKDVQHKFKQPAKPLEPPTPRTSVLGLDRLAKEKRAASTSQDGDRKRLKLNSDKLFKVPVLPGPRPGHSRQRGDETPSHPGGLSEASRKKLEEYRRNRDRQREGINAVEDRRDNGQKGLGEFQRRSNRDRGYDRRNWDETPRSERGGSVRVPNVGWESTPRNSRSDGGGWGRVGDRSWDAQTPRVTRDTSPDGDGRAFGLDSREWEEEQVRLDRDWYTGAEEGGVVGDEEHNPLSQYEDLTVTKEAEIASKQIKKVSARQAQYNADNDLWESNRMVTSGVAMRQAIDLDFEDESESTVHVMVHDLKPPFLDGRTVFTKQLDPINPIRDPTSDLAVFSRKGSALVKEKREQAERAKAAAKMTALGGTALGNIMGVKDEEGEGAYKHNSRGCVMLGGHSRSLLVPVE